MVNYNPNLVISTTEFDVIGTRPIRHDVPDKVLGKARYAADVHPTGLLHGKLLRSPHAHAVIKSIDTSRALALAGVKAVATSADLPEVSAEIADQAEGGIVNYGFYSRNVLAREKALYRGHAVAAVAATSPSVAEEALSLIHVDYEVLSPVLDAYAAKIRSPLFGHLNIMFAVGKTGSGYEDELTYGLLNSRCSIRPSPIRHPPPRSITAGIVQMASSASSHRDLPGLIRA